MVVLQQSLISSIAWRSPISPLIQQCRHYCLERQFAPDGWEYGVELIATGDGILGAGTVKPVSNVKPSPYAKPARSTCPPPRSPATHREERRRAQRVLLAMPVVGSPRGNPKPIDGFTHTVVATAP